MEGSWRTEKGFAVEDGGGERVGDDRERFKEGFGGGSGVAKGLGREENIGGSAG